MTKRYTKAQITKIEQHHNWFVKQDADGNLVWSNSRTAESGWRPVSKAQVDAALVIDEAKRIQLKINDAADQILQGLGKQCGGDVHVGIAALAVAMCSVARAGGLSLDKVTEALDIASRQVNA